MRAGSGRVGSARAHAPSSRYEATNKSWRPCLGGGRGASGTSGHLKRSRSGACNVQFGAHRKLSTTFTLVALPAQLNHLRAKKNRPASSVAAFHSDNGVAEAAIRQFAQFTPTLRPSAARRTNRLTTSPASRSSCRGRTVRTVWWHWVEHFTITSLGETFLQIMNRQCHVSPRSCTARRARCHRLHGKIPSLS